jgi:hypothetical protein
MKKILLAGVAALFLATGAAARLPPLPVTPWTGPSDPVPDGMLGEWCVNFEASDPNQQVYYRNRECTDSIDLDPEGYIEVDGKCIFDRVQMINADTYWMHTRCEMLSEGDGHGLGKYYFQGVLEFQLLNRMLFIKRVTES